VQTIRQIERFWTGRQYDRLARELLAARMEFSDRLVVELARPVPAAALALIRLDELNQGYHPLNEKCIRTIIAAQEGDGGWGEPIVSALCVRALMCNRGRGVVVERGIAHLAALQKPEGCWPAVAVRRTTGDAFVTAFILFQLADQADFRAAVRIEDAAHWLAQNESQLGGDARRLWRPASLRCRVGAVPNRTVVAANN
jgi:hypothetical protein